MQNDVSSDPVGLLEFVTRNLATSKEDISINPIVGSHSLVLELRLNAQDVGRVIGRGGRVARAIRTLLQSVSDKQFYIEGRQERFQKITLEIID